MFLLFKIKEVKYKYSCLAEGYIILYPYMTERNDENHNSGNNDIERMILKTPVLKKKRCGQCLRRPGLLSICKYCELSYCFGCVQQEIHFCKGLNELKNDRLKMLSEQLNNERVVKRKIEAI